MGPSPLPVDDQQRLSPDFVGWMMGFPARWNEGETRNQRLRQFGNAVVWQQAHRALELLLGEREP